MIKTIATADICFHSLVSELPRWDVISPEMMSLAEDIKRRGIDQPLLVVPPAGDGVIYRLVDGRHRYLAAGIAQIKEVPCIVRDENEAPDIVLHSLVQRRHYTKGALAYLSCPVFAAAVAAGVEKRSQNLKEGVDSRKSTESTFGESVEEIAARMGFSRDLYFQARDVHKRFAVRPDYREQFEPAILSGELGLGGALQAMAGKESTEGKSKINRAPSLLLAQALKQMTFRFGSWSKLEASERNQLTSAVVDCVVEQWPDDLKSTLARALGAGVGRETRAEGREDAVEGRQETALPGVATSYTGKPLYLAFVSRYSKERLPVVKPYDAADYAESMQSLSVFWLAAIEADSQDEAEGIAKRMLAAGEGLITDGGQREGFTFEEVAA